MSEDARTALSQLIGAFERHLEACASKRGEDDPGVLAAADDLADAFEAYDDALLTAYGEMTPLDVYSEDELGEDDEDDEDDEDLDDLEDEDDLDDLDDDLGDEDWDEDGEPDGDHEAGAPVQPSR